MKYEWRKVEAEYMTKAKPEKRLMPPQQFLTIKGQGNQNSPEFAEKVGALYAVSYALKMMPRKGIEVAGYQDYVVYPLEGFWTMPDDFTGGAINKDLLIYEIMIKQPFFVTDALVEKAKEMSVKKVSESLLASLEFKTIDEGEVVQMLHKGSFDEEYLSFEKMALFCEENNLNRTGYHHKEIYLSDIRKVTPDKYKTILRIGVEPRTKMEN